MLYFWSLHARPSVSIIFRWSPTFIRCFDPKQWHPLVGGSAVHYSTDPDFQHRSSRRCLLQQDDLSAVSPSFLIVVLRVRNDIPSRVSSFHTDWAGNPLQPTSTGNNHTLDPLFLQSAIRSAYLRLFLSCASSQLSSHGTVSSIATKVFDCWDTSTTSRLRLVFHDVGEN